ncbi:hypothetical protein L211DRAFT_799097 [Terfezia boudieri ATCC MYA-4762]|uniref:Uncharacterized protein n=1 Tax=Terfezia boudieri ATCC MYA-4762 TaxID=1051890 RepID=A0A3N4L888_9PEZI|nr:hypothetical protein L211DRAFT_799097 [Terfezia boudieri ATCC MYA-4762]
MDYLHTALAPCFGDNSPECVRMLDKDLQVAAFAATKEISKLSPDQRSWEAIVSAFTTNPLLEEMDDSTVYIADNLIKENINFFKFDGSPDKAVVTEVMTWFKKLVRDEDVVRATPIDIRQLARIVAQTGAGIDWQNIITVVHNKEKHSKKVLDVGVLRYPDISHPYLKVYRIQLEAWSSCERIGPCQRDSNGISGAYNCRKYKPRDDVIRRLKPEVLEMAAKAGEAFLLS